MIRILPASGILFFKSLSNIIRNKIKKTAFGSFKAIRLSPKTAYTGERINGYPQGYATGPRIIDELRIV
ncbi:MAG: hypothetical protein GX421_08595 [Caldisericales bacterium]|nr:hypothetical protein [Caldisericales bacterium]